MEATAICPYCSTENTGEAEFSQDSFELELKCENCGSTCRAGGSTLDFIVDWIELIEIGDGQK